MPRSFLVKRNGMKEDGEQANDGQTKAVTDIDSSQYLEYAITLLALSKNTQWSWDYELEKSYWFDTTSKGTFTALLNDDKPDPYKPLNNPDSDLLSTVNALTMLKDSKIAYSAEKPKLVADAKDTSVVENKENKTEFYDWFTMQTNKQQQQQLPVLETPSLFPPQPRILQGDTLNQKQRQIYIEPHHNLSFVEQLTSRITTKNEQLSDRSTDQSSSESSTGQASPSSSIGQPESTYSTGHTSPGSSVGQSEGSYSTGQSSPDEGIMLEEAVVTTSTSDDIHRSIQQFLVNNPVAYDDITMETGINKEAIHKFVESHETVSAENKQKMVTWYTTKILKQPPLENADESYTCHKCGKIFTYRSYLERHIKYVCPDSTGRTWKCSFCGKAFQYPCYLRRHIRSHTGESPYKCEKCDRAFVRSTDLQRHIRNHTGEKPYRCSQCSRAFARSTDLKRHMRTHTGEKPYKCWKCGKSFSQSGSLQTHLHTHEKDIQSRQKDGQVRQKHRSVGGK